MGETQLVKEAGFQPVNLLQFCSAESSGFTFRFEESEDVTLSHWAFYVSDKGSVLMTDKGNFNLCDASSGA